MPSSLARVPLGVAIPQTFPDGPLDPGQIRRYLQRAEALGFDSAWVIEQILGRIPILEPLALLTWAAALTERLRLGSAVLLPALRNPIHLAKSLATLDHLSQGRLIVGVGLGGNTPLYPAFGVPVAGRVERFAEGLRLMISLWTEPRTIFQGRYWRLDGARMEPKPVQRPHPPIWFGAHHPNALRRAVELGQGFIGAGSTPTATFLEEVRVLRGLLGEAGRDPATFGVGKRVYIAIDSDRGRATRRLADWFGAFYGRPELAEQVAVRGEPAECVDRLREVVEGGARFLMLHPVFDELTQLERLAAEVAPKL
jgi:probable F420-dependent oxidoreductase